MIRSALLTLVMLSFASTADAWETPRQALDEFLAFELDGGRLQSWPFATYLDVVDEYDEPGWDSVHVVRGAEVVSFDCAKTQCDARVRFDFEPTTTFESERAMPHPDGGSETLEFTVVRSKGQWRLAASGDYPRVTLDALRKRGLVVEHDHP